MKISDEVPRDRRTIVESVNWTHGLETVFRQNTENDKLLRYVDSMDFSCKTLFFQI